MTPPRPDDEYLARIAADPDDDDARLAYAAGRRAADDPRGDFILAQFEIANLLDSLGPSPEFDEARAVNARIAELKKQVELHLARNEPRWLGRDGGELYDLVLGASWHKGFPAHLVVEAQAFLEHADAIAEKAPTVVSLDLVLPDEVIVTPDFITAALHAPALTRIRHLALAGRHWGDAAARAAASSPSLGQLRTLAMTDAGLGASGATSLLRSQGLPALGELNLSGNSIGPGWCSRLAALRKIPPSLISLVLDDISLDDDTARGLAETKALSSLRELSLSDNPLSPAGVRALVHSPVLQHVVLHVDTDCLGPEERVAVARRLAERQPAVTAERAGGLKN